jgi:G2/mitotic-specific cyclin 1/2
VSEKGKSSSEKSSIQPPKPKVTKKAVVKEDQVIKVNKSRVRHPATMESAEEVEEPFTKKAKTSEWDDLDADDFGDPSMVSEYVVEIFEYMKKLELETMPDSNYIDDQKDLQWGMRSILVDWLIEVHHKFHLLPETLYLTVNIIDRFLSLRAVSLIKLQLVGVAAMFIASKYEEILTPSLSNFIYMADGGYTEEEVLKAERYILQVLDFSLQYPSPMSFLRRVSKAENYDHQTRTLAKYLMEVSLIDHRFLDKTPSLIAASGLYLARQMLDRGDWVKFFNLIVG